jgi:orotate phosphoribosyltransferase
MEATSAVFARFRNAGKTQMTLQEAENLSWIVAERVQSAIAAIDGSAPAGVVGIATGGLMIAKIVAIKLGLPLEVLFVRRQGSRLKRILGVLPFAAQLAAFLLTIGPLRKRLVPALNLMNRLETKKSDGESAGSVSGPVILVDDCIQSGASALHAKRQLEGSGRRVMLTAVLAISGKGLAPHIAAEIGPMIVLLPRIHHFPWSQNNPEYRQFQDWLKMHEISRW